MIVFLVGWSPRGTASESAATQALRSAETVREKLGPEVRSWRSADGRVALAWVSHPETAVPSARYVDITADRLTVFSGRPFVWTDEFETDGESPLDAAFFRDFDLASDELDGRFAVVRYESENGTLTVRTDALGSYPLFQTEADGTTWIGNAPFTLANAAGRAELSTAALGHFLTIGWSLGGSPLWRGVDRIDRGVVEVRQPDGATSRRELLPLSAIRGLFGGRPEMTEAAGTLTAIVRGLGQWPGRPNVVPISAGRDSRVVFAAAVASGIEFTARTIAFPRHAGYPQTEDVVLGGAVASAMGRDRVVVEPEEAGGLDWSAALVREITHGFVSLGETGLVPRGGGLDPLEIVHSGHFGELSRGLLFAGDRPTERELVEHLYRKWVYRLPPPVVRDEVLAATREYVRDWVRSALGAGLEAADVPDVFYALERMQHWVAPPQHLQEASNDTTAPLWSPRMLRFTFADTSRARTAEPLHLALLEGLAPALARLPFDGVNPPWPTFPQQRRMRSQRALLLKVRRELQRRAISRRAARAGTLDPLLQTAHAEVSRAANDLQGHPLWEVIDQARLRRLLRRDLHALDPRSQALVWRLATLLAPGHP